MIFALAVFAVKSTVVLLFALLASLVCRRMGAGYRHLIWTAGFAAILVLPVLQGVLPTHAVPILPAAASPKVVLSAPSPANDVESIPFAFADLEKPGDSASAFRAIPRREADQSAFQGGEPAAANLGRAGTPSVSGAGSTGGQIDWPRMILAIWLFGFLVVLGQHLISLAVLSRSARRATSLDPAPFVDVATRAGVDRPWRLVRQGVAGPRTWGVLYPTIAFPEASLHWPPDQIEAVLLHELAHVRRWDSLSQSFSTVACAANWFNPLVWLCARQARMEAERAADDAVLAEGVKPSIYAEALLTAARHSKFHVDPFLSAGVPLMKQSKIETRIQSILSHRSHSREVSPFGLISTALIAVALAAPCAALTAKAAEPQTPVLQAIEVTHTAKAPQSTTAHNHQQGSADAAALRAQIRALKLQLAQEHAQLARARKQMEGARAKQEAMLDRQIAIERSLEAKARMQSDKIAVKNQALARQAEKMAAERDMRVRQEEKLSARAGQEAKMAAEENLRALRAERGALEAQRMASKVQLDEMAAKVRAGVMERSELAKAKADLAAKNADMIAAEVQLKMSAADARRHADRDRVELRERSVFSQRIAAVKARLAEAEAELRADKKLYAQGALSKSRLAQASAIVEKLRAEIDELRAQGRGRGE